MSHSDMPADVRAFHEKFGILTADRPGHLSPEKARERVECLKEELQEYVDALEANDLGAQTDGLLDLIYFALGTLVMMGVDTDAHWREVQRANMAKVRGVGHRGHAVDCVKPEGWEPPNHDGLLARQGYDRAVWVDDLDGESILTLGRTDGHPGGEVVL